MNKIIKQFYFISIFVFVYVSFYVSWQPSFAQEPNTLQPNIQPTVESEIAMDILGTTKQTTAGNTKNVKPQTLKSEDENLITFSARNISVKDAFATLARISGKSISVGSDIRDEDTISVVEIRDQPFESAFFSLLDASNVNYTTTGQSYTVIRGAAARPIMIFELGAVSVDKTLPINERRADISYDNQDLATLLKDLANKYGIDVVLTATPTERVSCRVRNIGIEDALKLVLSGTSFDYTISGEKEDTFIIYNRLNKNYTVGQESKMFALMNLEAMDVQALLPVEVRANVRISNDQNSIIADGSANDLQRIEEFLFKIDRPLPQVELELKLIEVSRRASEDLKLFKDGGFVIGKIAKGVTIFDFSPDLWMIFNKQLTYLEKLGLAQVRAYPKLVSLSGRTAMINIDQDTNLVLGAATGQGQQIGVVATQQLQRITAGTALSITPIVGTGGLITAKIQIEVSDNSGTTTQNGVTVPATTTRRRINADVQVRDGETVAIGGLLINNTSLDRVGLPFLTRLPFISNFASNRNRQKTQSELIVLITPTIRNIPEENVTAKEGNMVTGVPSG